VRFVTQVLIAIRIGLRWTGYCVIALFALLGAISMMKTF
jgi:hypothetical protein